VHASGAVLLIARDANADVVCGIAISRCRAAHREGINFVIREAPMAPRRDLGAKGGTITGRLACTSCTPDISAVPFSFTASRQ